MMTDKFLESFDISYKLEDFNSVEECEKFKLECWIRYQLATKSNDENPIVSRRSKV